MTENFSLDFQSSARKFLNYARHLKKIIASL